MPDAVNPCHKSLPKPKAKWRRPLNGVSRRRAESFDLRDHIRKQVFDRDGGCVLHGERWHDGSAHECDGPLDPHHRRKASAGGSFTLTNLVTVCRRANQAIEDHPDFFRATYPWLVVRIGDVEYERLGYTRHNGPVAS